MSRGRVVVLIACAALLAACKARDDGATGAPSASSSARPGPRVEVPTSLGLPPELAAHLATMSNAPAYGGLAIGIGGVPSSETEAFRAILSTPQAGPAFAFAADHATTAGRLYGISGLYLVDRPAYEQRIDAFRHLRDSVILWTSGCTGGHPIEVPELVAHPTGSRLDGPFDTIAAWRARHPGETSEPDIVGGFYPLLLAGSQWARPDAPPSPPTAPSASPSAGASAASPRPRPATIPPRR